MDHVNRNRWIVGIVILIVFMTLVIAGSAILFREWHNRQAKVNQRKPLASLGYCNPNQVKPCILSFNLDSSGNMIINLLMESSSGFYLKINHNEASSIYKCQKVKEFSTNVSCVGKPMPLGETLQFLIISSKGDTLLAEGRFPIIGLALATPEIAATLSPETLLTPSSTDNFLTMTPTSIVIPPNAGSPPASSTDIFFVMTPTQIGSPPNSGSPPP